MAVFRLGLSLLEKERSTKSHEEIQFRFVYFVDRFLSGPENLNSVAEKGAVTPRINWQSSHVLDSAACPRIILTSVVGR